MSTIVGLSFNSNNAYSGILVAIVFPLLIFSIGFTVTRFLEDRSFEPTAELANEDFHKIEKTHSEIRKTLVLIATLIAILIIINSYSGKTFSSKTDSNYKISTCQVCTNDGCKNEKIFESFKVQESSVQLIGSQLTQNKIVNLPMEGWTCSITKENNSRFSCDSSYAGVVSTSKTHVSFDGSNKLVWHNSFTTPKSWTYSNTNCEIE